MEQQVPTSVLALFGISALLSFASLFYLFQKHIDGRPLLLYQPRLRVPWGIGIALLAISIPLANILVFLSTQIEPGKAEKPPAKQTEGVDETEEDTNEQASEKFISVSWNTFAFMMAFVFGVGTLILVLYQADSTDLGLPTSWPQALQDTGIGCFATVASLLPIYTVQLFLINALNEKTKHPLVEQIEADPSPAMLVAGLAMAVIAAPFFEEFTFRCLLQGWLEKVEDEKVCYLGSGGETLGD